MCPLLTSPQPHHHRPAAPLGAKPSPVIQLPFLKHMLMFFRIEPARTLTAILRRGDGDEEFKS
jgi:hypothetical protein